MNQSKDQEISPSFLGTNPSFEQEEDHSTFLENAEMGLTDELDHQILMHRDAHFGGDFSVMIAYYEQDSIGVQSEFDFDRIMSLAEIERSIGQNLAPLILSGPEAEKVAASKKMYRRFKTLYEEAKEGTPALYIADLILAEGEGEKEIEQALAKQTYTKQELIEVIQDKQLYDPLFPGYGYAPCRAAIALGKIKDPETVVPLFEMFHQELVFEEEVVLEALRSHGNPAKEFLLKLVKSRPITQDTIHAAFALTGFGDDLAVAHSALEQLEDPKVLQSSLLSSYLLCCIEALRGTSEVEKLKQIAMHPQTPESISREIQSILKLWSI